MRRVMAVYLFDSFHFAEDPPLVRLVTLSNHKLVIAKAKADCDWPRAERRPPAGRRSPAARRVPDADEFAIFRKSNWLFFEA